MFNNYHELTDEIVELIGRSTYRGKVAGWLQLAESEACVALRDLREVRFKTTGNFVAGTDTITLPDGITGIDLFQIDTSTIRIVKPGSIQELAARRQQHINDTLPVIYVFTGAKTIELSPTPASTQAYTLYHTKSMVDVTHLKYTSNILEEAPFYLFYRAAMHAYIFMRNSEEEAKMEARSGTLLTTYGQFLARKDKDIVQVRSQRAALDQPHGGGGY